MVSSAQYQVFTWLEHVSVQGTDSLVLPKKHRILIMNKPNGVTSLAEGDNSVLKLVPEELSRPDLGIYGRLDKDTTGLLLLGSDGGIGQLLTHPTSGVTKQYLAELNRKDGKWALCDNAEERFAAGLVLQDGTSCRPARLVRLKQGNSAEQVRVYLHEGKYHQVKKMLAACGAYVKSLHRERVGELELPSELQPGNVRELTRGELQVLRGMLPKLRMLPRKMPRPPPSRVQVQEEIVLVSATVTAVDGDEEIGNTQEKHPDQKLEQPPLPPPLPPPQQQPLPQQQQS